MKLRRVLLLLACLLPTSVLAAANVATSGTATQSSTWHVGVSDAIKAIDGNRNGNYNNGSVSHTGTSPQEWWQVTLPGLYVIDEINVFNRTDCCSERINPFNLYIYNGATVVQQFLNQTFTPTITEPGISGMTFDTFATGDRVRVQLAGTNYLQLAEVEVFGAAAAPVPEPSTYLLMLAGLGAVLTIARRRTRQPFGV